MGALLLTALNVQAEYFSIIGTHNAKIELSESTPVIGDTPKNAASSVNILLGSSNMYWGADAVGNGSLFDDRVDDYGVSVCVDFYSTARTMTISVNEVVKIGLHGNTSSPQYNGVVNLRDSDGTLLDTLTTSPSEYVRFETVLQINKEYILEGAVGADIVFCEIVVY